MVGLVFGFADADKLTFQVLDQQAPRETTAHPTRRAPSKGATSKSARPLMSSQVLRCREEPSLVHGPGLGIGMARADRLSLVTGQSDAHPQPPSRR